MTKTFKFSIIIAIYNAESYLKETITSLLNQTLSFRENIQLILIDDGSLDNSLKIALNYQKQYPNNIMVFSKENEGQASARNLGLRYAKGKYINFLDSDDYISNNTLKEVYNFFEKHSSEIDIVAIPMILFERTEGPHRLNYKFNKKYQIINLKENPNNPLLSASSSFIKYSSIKDFQFDTSLPNLEDALIINKILLDKQKYGAINTCKYYYRQRILRNSTVDNLCSKKEYFTLKLKNFYLNIINYCLYNKNEIPLFIQYLIVYDLQWLLKVPELDIFDNEDETEEFWLTLNSILEYIEINVILHNNNILDDIKSFFIYLFFGEKHVKINNNGLVTLNTNEYEIDTLNKHKIWLDIININNNVLNISGIYISNFNNENISLRILKKNTAINTSDEYYCKQVYYNVPERKNQKYLGIEWKFRYNFDAKIPISPNEEYDLNFFIDYEINGEKHSYELLVDVNSSANISKYSSYLINKPYLILMKYNKLHIKPYSFLLTLRYEYSNLKCLMLEKPSFYTNAFLLRILYFILYYFMKNRKIWIFGDRPDLADDNAKYLFEYSINKNDGIYKYFVVKKNSNSFNELKKNNSNIVPFGSLKHKILFLFSEKNICSYVNIDFINPFFNHNIDLYKGISNPKRYFLQHGVTKDNISKFVNKQNHNLSLIVTVSDLEKKSFLENGYNYNESIIKTLGFPRYDKLKKSYQKKQILFMPTWRLQLDNSEKFLKSEYYNYLNDILNNDRLFKLLEKYDYKFVFKPHIELEKYLYLLNFNKKVILSTNESYNDLFNQSSLLITDYSSVFFDFGYLMKPVIYYQPNNDYHYDQGYFDYQKIGFGEVIYNKTTLLKKIEYYLENNCDLEQKFRNNINNFFKFKDQKNCNRIYSWILSH